MSEFTCEVCKKTYPKRNDDEWSDFKAAEEFLTLTPECKNNPTSIVCEPCFQEWKKWFDTLTEDYKRKMREDFDNAIV